MTEGKSLGTVIDEIVASLSALPEASRVTAVKTACEHVGVDLSPIGRQASNKQVSPMPPVTPPSSLAPLATDVRSLKEQKKPGSALEMAVVLAYYLQHLAPAEERKSQITAADIDKYFVHADYPLPRRSDQLLVDARAAGYFDSHSRGTYGLNPVGHNLVAHSLPRASGSQSAAKRPAARAGLKKNSKGKKSMKKTKL